MRNERGSKTQKASKYLLAISAHSFSTYSELSEKLTFLTP